MMVRNMLLVTLLLLPLVSLACKCMVPLVSSALDDADAVFRGMVIRELKQTDPTSYTKELVVKVERVFKGCTFKVSDRIIVATSSSTASCGVFTETNKAYVFSGSSSPIAATTKQKLGKNTKISQLVSVMSCVYNREWDGVPAEDKALLRAYKNQCAKSCVTGKDCPNEKHYCDTGKCIDLTAGCPITPLLGACIQDACKTAADSCPGAYCEPTFCGGCLPLFLDADRTRICN
jgi:hypothetical protein